MYLNNTGKIDKKKVFAILFELFKNYRLNEYNWHSKNK